MAYLCIELRYRPWDPQTEIKNAELNLASGLFFATWKT